MDAPMIAALFHQLPPLDRVNLGTRGPAPFLVTGEDRVRVTGRNGATGITIQVSGRFLTIDGELQPIAYDLVPPTDFSAGTVEFSLGDGWILNMVARVTAGTPQDGETYALVEVIRGAGASGIVLGTLLGGFVTDGCDLAWPGSPIRSSAAGPGALRPIAGADPAAGAEWTITIPTGTRYRLRSVSAVLVTDATAANREVSIVITAGAVVVASVASGVNHVASQTRRYSAFPTAVRGAAAQSLDLLVPLPYVELRGGDTVTSVTTNLQAGDNWAAPQAFGERVLDA